MFDVFQIVFFIGFNGQEVHLKIRGEIKKTSIK